MKEYYRIFNENLQRVNSLLALYSQIKKMDVPDKSKEYLLTDILRSATVFLHSIFEEYYRNIISYWLPIKGDRDALKNITLPENGGKRDTKYALYDLYKFKDKTIGDLFLESLHEYMSRVSFNSYSEICSWGDKIGLNFSKFEEAEVIEKTISRRHKIVHEADADRSEKRKHKSIRESEVYQWKEKYSLMVDLIDEQIGNWEAPIIENE